MHAACLQLRVDLCHPSENTARALKMAGQAIDQGAQILVLPELFSSGFCYSMPPEEPPYHSLDPFRALAQEHGCLVIGSLMSGRHNLGFCLEADRIHYQPKVHPFDKEREHFIGGDRIAPLPTTFGRVGLEVCYDLRFPEMARSLALQEADFLVTVGQWPAQRLAHWRILCHARAIENQIPHVACNWANAGGSLIIDARGNVVAEAGNCEAVLIGEVDLKKRNQWRDEIFYLGDRRPNIYWDSS
jgi:predicted amidohydrolase